MPAYWCKAYSHSKLIPTIYDNQCPTSSVHTMLSALYMLCIMCTCPEIPWNIIVKVMAFRNTFQGSSYNGYTYLCQVSYHRLWNVMVLGKINISGDLCQARLPFTEYCSTQVAQDVHQLTLILWGYISSLCLQRLQSSVTISLCPLWRQPQRS